MTKHWKTVGAFLVLFALPAAVQARHQLTVWVKGA